MKFNDSLGSRGVISGCMEQLVINSSASANPESVMNIDDFFSSLSQFHNYSIDTTIQELVHNFGQPVYDFEELKVRTLKEAELDEIAAQIQLDNGIDI
ncbi:MULTISPECIES: hypothetical protein [Vibrio]|uniref:hypothetical protein n=1 Tax=Vibrio TaxID=662 RepID=UPI001E630B28|nr:MULTISPECIES: hypothetical protein [Vibrio]MCC2524938.1 hypothetical protein [Vibrio coralliilyticus]USD35484.1 hypothetical protein J8Z27_22965 [Vibrio sp. SCSIO 43186]USD72608.1 hypothetical protein J4N41_22970 [Vibrio sp. SCSIO 43139]USD98999.1 hypothetical protein CTT30_23280 [Vibrio coralliilyticus]